jgi:threonine dehydratase
LVSRLLAGSLVVSVPQVVVAVRWLAERLGLIVEGAGALGLAAARTHPGLGRNLVVIISGGNIDPEIFTAMLLGRGEIPVPGRTPA